MWAWGHLFAIWTAKGPRVDLGALTYLGWGVQGLDTDWRCHILPAGARVGVL